MMNEVRRAFFRHGYGRGLRGPWGMGFGFGKGGWEGGWVRRMRRGDAKFAVLEVLAEGPRHGYEIIRAIAERRGAPPSPGSVYPTLQMLEDGGFVTSAQVDGKRVYTITDSGRELLANRNADIDDDDEAEVTPHHRLRESAMKLAAAVMGARGSDEKMIERIRETLDKARKDVYAILASDEA